MMLLLLIHAGETRADSDLERLTVAAETPLRGHGGGAFKSHPCPLKMRACQKKRKKEANYL